MVLLFLELQKDLGISNFIEAQIRQKTVDQLLKLEVVFIKGVYFVKNKNNRVLKMMESILSCLTMNC